MGGATTERWHEPSVLDVAVETTRRGINGPGPWRWRSVLVTIVSLVVLALVLPRVGSDAWDLTVLAAPILIAATLAYQAGRRQKILGRDTSRVAAAVAVTLLGMMAFAVLFAGTSLLIGQPEAPMTTFLHELDSRGLASTFVVVFVVGLGLLAIVSYVRTKPARKAAEAALEEEARIERAARAAAAGKG